VKNVKSDNIETYFKMIESLATLSKCKKLSVGSFIIKNNSIASSGINGTPIGYENNCEKYVHKCNICNRDNEVITTAGGYHYYCDCGVEHTIDEISNHIKVVSNDFVIHSEENAILHAVRNHISLDGTSIIVSHAPCIKCSKLIHGAGIAEVIYKDEYKNTTGVDLLRALKVKVTKWKKEKTLFD